MKRIVLIVTLLLLVGCGTYRTGPQVPQTFTGTQGITFERIVDAPPRQILEGTSAPLVFKLENRGAYTVEYGRYWLGGVQDEYFTLSDQDTYVQYYDDNGGTFNLEGRSRYYPQGGQVIITRQIRAKTLTSNQQISRQRITPQLCYPYQTIATAPVCIDTDPFPSVEDSRNKVCNYKQPVTLTGGQGGPLEVAQIKTEMIQDGEYYKPQFTITVNNAGNGRFVEQRNYMDFCEGRVNTELLNKVTISGTISNEPINCTKRIVDKQTNALVCTGPKIPRSRGNYQAPLQLEFNYGYVENMPPIEFEIVPLGNS